MDTPIHSINSLFAQLGLPNTTDEVDAFIEHHRPLPDYCLLHEAPFWTASQATFLSEEIEDDAIFGALDALHPGETMRFTNDHNRFPGGSRRR